MKRKYRLDTHVRGHSGPSAVLVAVAITLLLVLSGSGFADTVFTDAVGRRVLLDQEPRRIVTLAPSLTEILYFLGLGDRVIGVSSYSSYPPEAAAKPKVGSYVDLNVEKILDLSPDLVIGTADGNRPFVVDLLEKAGIPVFIVNPRNVRQVLDSIVTLGRLCGVPERALLLTEGLTDRVEGIVARTAALERPLVFLQVNPKPIMSVNGDTFSSDLIRLAGGLNMTGEEPVSYPRISLEEVIRREPDVILISSMERGGQFEETRREWLRFESIPAARDGRVHLVDSDLVDRPSPRIIQGLEAMARYIHPDAGWDD